MKVALELQPCCGNRSGIGFYTYELARRLHGETGLEFVGNIFNFAGRNDNSTALKGITIPIQESKVFPYGVYRRIWNIIPISYRSMFPAADLTVFFNFIVPPRISGKVMTTVHDLTYLRFPETMEAKNYRRLQLGMDYSLKRSNRILTVSEFSKQEICQLLTIPEEKVSVVYNAPALSEEVADMEPLFNRHGITKPYILYVGTLEPRKNLMRLMQAFEKLKRVEGIPHQLVLAGGKGWNSKDILEYAQKNPDILPIGYVTNAEKNALYQDAALFAFPSLYEGFGIPPLEAMHFGCPVVCANTASLPEVVGDAAELVDPMEVDSIAEGMLRVLTDESHRTELVRKGYIQAKKFNWEDSANKLMQICREVLEES